MAMSVADTYKYLAENKVIDSSKMQFIRFFELVHDALRVVGGGINATARCTESGLVIKGYNGQKTIKWSDVISRNY